MKLQNLFMTTSLIALGIISCNNEDYDLQNKGDGTDGEETYMSLTLSFPKTDGPQFRATGDNNATLEETALDRIDVFIFNSNTGFMVKNAVLNASNFDQLASTSSEDVWKAKTTIGTTTGQKTIFVGINLPVTFAQGLNNTSLANFNDIAHTLNISELVTTQGLAMFSAKGTTSELKPIGDPAYNTNNVLKIPIKRMVAKITVEEGENMVINGAGKLDNLSFAISNINKKMYLVPKTDGSDPNYAANTWLAGDFISAVNTPGGAGDGFIRIDSAKTEVKKLKTLYATENTSVNHWKEEITRVIVRATFVPEKITDLQGANYVQIANPNSSPTTFWTVLLQNGFKYFFLNESTANAYKAANPGSIKSAAYTNGYCYYDMYLNKDGYFQGNIVTAKKWDVFRNDYYRCRITNILAPGRPTENLVDPKTPPAVETDLQFDLDILFWNLITGDYSLEP